jgi:hypothetical protein
MFIMLQVIIKNNLGIYTLFNQRVQFPKHSQLALCVAVDKFDMTFSQFRSHVQVKLLKMKQNRIVIFRECHLILISLL